ncbi:MAG TPA: helix-turn-helix domain-containing protein [Roseiflexaceae bacterium]|nr:helix-turn-helix domain-containing protein [Roseiflexaceae bacterium]HMP39443.1 helix-turn-helix domain-containing protein [Roseiflexaceae bacterium]
MSDTPIEIAEDRLPVAEHVIDSIDALRVIADPLRMAILEQLASGPQSAKQLVAALKIPKTKIYYHMNLLEEHGLVWVVGTRVVSGIIEKWYGVRALTYRVDRALFDLFSGDEQALEQFSVSLFDTVQKGLIRSIRERHASLAPTSEPARRLLMARRLLRLEPYQLQTLYDRLTMLIEEYSAQARAVSSASDGAAELFIVLFPTEASTAIAPARSQVAEPPIAEPSLMSLAAMHAASMRHMRGPIIPPAIH